MSLTRWEYADSDCPRTLRVYSDSAKFTYDAVGNRIDNGAIVDTATRVRQLGRWTLEYDDGNLIYKFDASCPSTCDRIYTWNSLGELVSVAMSDGPTTTYGYDGRGRRIRRTQSSGAAATSEYSWN